MSACSHSSGHDTRECTKTTRRVLQCACGYQCVYIEVVMYESPISNKSCRNCGMLGKLREVEDTGRVAQRDKSCGGWLDGRG